MTWRLRIGRFAPRRRRLQGKHRQDHGKRDEWKEMGTESKSSSGTNLPSLRTNRTHAKVGFLFTLLYVAVVTMCATKSSAKMGNLHDLSAQILLGGDISPNPGPAASVQTEVSGADLTDKSRFHSPDLDHWERCFRSLESKMQRKMKKIEQELKKQKTITAEIAHQCARDKKDTLKLEQTLRRDMERLTNNVDTFASDIANKVRFNEDQTDKIEGNLKKNNIKLYGIPEPENEPYWNCLQNVLHLLREAMPGMTWSEKDLVKVQRLGQTGRGQRGRSRPVLVQMSTFLDKLVILRHGRDPLRSRGIRVSSELTSRQVKTLNDLRDQGHTAFYRGNRLWFQDDRRYSRRGHPPPHRGRFQERRGERTSYRQRARHTAQHDPPDRYEQADDPTTVPHHQNEQQSGGMETGWWMHPDEYLTWGYQDHPPSGPQNQADPQWDEEFRFSDPPEENERNAHTRRHKEVTPPKNPPPTKPDDGSSEWGRIVSQFSSHGDSSPSGSDSDSDSQSCDDDQYKGGGLNDQHSVISQRSEVSQFEGSHCGATVLEKSGNSCDGRLQETVCTDQLFLPEIPSESPKSGNHDPKRCTQSSVLDWVTRRPRQTPDTDMSKKDTSGSEKVQATTESEAGTASSPAPPSVWHGRLRQNVARDGPDQTDKTA